MFTELLNKQVVCPQPEILQFMYPEFKIVNSEFEIYPDEPFIYLALGNKVKYINKVNKRPELHIIIADTGEYDLSNMDTLINLAYMKHNKKRPAYVDELIKVWEPPKNRTYSDEFLYNWKHLWITGSIPDKEIQQNRIYIEIINEINNPAEMLKLFLTNSTEDNVRYLESSIIKFMKDGLKAPSPESLSSGKNWTIKKQQIFYASFSNNVPYGIKRLLSSNGRRDNLQVRLYSLLKDVTLGDKV